VLKHFQAYFLKNFVIDTGLNTANVCICDSTAQHTSSGIIKNGFLTLESEKEYFPWSVQTAVKFQTGNFFRNDKLHCPAAHLPASLSSLKIIKVIECQN
jgi:hypothetical protein